MEPEEEKRLNDELIGFVRKRSETEAPHYVARLRRLVDVHAKKCRATLARRHSELCTCHANINNAPTDTDAHLDLKRSEFAGCAKGKVSSEQSAAGENDNRKIKRRTEEQANGSGSGSRSEEPMERSCRKRRRRSCGRKRRQRRRSCCCRRIRRRRRRRSTSRRRRRRSGRRRRKGRMRRR